jgi:hypothetical protein
LERFPDNDDVRKKALINSLFKRTVVCENLDTVKTIIARGDDGSWATTVDWASIDGKLYRPRNATFSFNSPGMSRRIIEAVGKIDASGEAVKKADEALRVEEEKLGEAFRAKEGAERRREVAGEQLADYR